MTAPGIPNEFTLSTTCFGGRLGRIEDQVFNAVAMGFRRLELGLSEAPPKMDGLEDSRRETSIVITSMIAGCRDTRSGHLISQDLGSLEPIERERAMNSIRRHIRLAESWNCPTVVVRGSKIDAPDMREKGRLLESRLVAEGSSDELLEEVTTFVKDVQKKGQKQIEHLCRSLHTLMSEAPDIRFAIEPGMYIDDLLGFDAMGWVMDDLSAQGLCYWHDVGRVHLRSRHGLPEHGQWLEAFSSRMLGVHLQDAANEEAEMPLGLGEVDFKLLAGYIPKTAERVLELNERHGRAEILSSIQFLVDKGF